MIGNHIELNFTTGLRMNLEDNKIIDILKSIDKGANEIAVYNFDIVLKALNIGYVEIIESKLVLTDFGKFVITQN